MVVVMVSLSNRTITTKKTQSPLPTIGATPLLVDRHRPFKKGKTQTACLLAITPSSHARYANASGKEDTDRAPIYNTVRLRKSGQKPVDTRGKNSLLVWYGKRKRDVLWSLETRYYPGTPIVNAVVCYGLSD